MDENYKPQPSAGSGGQPATGSNEAFIAPSDRPSVKLDPEQPISELRVRDLIAIVAAATAQPFSKGAPKLPVEDYRSQKVEKEPIQDQPAQSVAGRPPHELIKELASSLNAMESEQMKLTAEVADLRTELAKLKPQV